MQYIHTSPTMREEEKGRDSYVMIGYVMVGSVRYPDSGKSNDNNNSSNKRSHTNLRVLPIPCYSIQSNLMQLYHIPSHVTPSHATSSNQLVSHEVYHHHVQSHPIPFHTISFNATPSDAIFILFHSI